MGRKVFISILGTGFYDLCNYETEKPSHFRSKETRFIQQATLEYLLKQEDSWTEKDVAYIFLTEKAKIDNWLTSPTGKRLNKKKSKEENYDGLLYELENMHLPFPFEGVGMADGMTDEKMWSAFNTIFEKIKDDDDLYLDVTHGFRYLPMLLLVLCNYAKYLKNVKIKSATYGNFEATLPDDAHPLMNLLPLVQLQDWTTAATNFTRFGDTKQLTDLCLQKNSKQTKKYAPKLQEFFDDIRFCRGDELRGGKADELLKNMVFAWNSTAMPINHIAEKIIENVKPVSSTDEYSNLFNMAALCYNYKQYQAAVTILEESVLSFILFECSGDFYNNYHPVINGANENEDTREFRAKGLIKEAVKMSIYRYKNYDDLGDNYWGNEVDNKESVNDILQYDFFQDEKNLPVFECIEEIRNIRNDYNHSGHRFSMNEIKSKLQDAIKLIQYRYIKQDVPIIKLNDD